MKYSAFDDVIHVRKAGKRAENMAERLSACLDEASKLVTELFGQPRSSSTDDSRVPSALSQAVNHTRSMLSQSSTNGLFPRLNRRQRERLRPAGGSSTEGSQPPKKKNKKAPEVKAFEYVLVNFEEDCEWTISPENTVLRGLIEINTSSSEAEIRREIGKATRLQYPMVGDQDFVFLRASRRKISVPLNCKSFDYRQLKLLAGQGAIYVKLKDGLDCLLVDEKEEEQIDEDFALPPPLSPPIQNNHETSTAQVLKIDDGLNERRNDNKIPGTIQQQLSYSASLLSTTCDTEISSGHNAGSSSNNLITQPQPTPVITAQPTVPEPQQQSPHINNDLPKAENSDCTVSVDDIVKEAVVYLKTHNIDDSIEIMRYFQKIMVIGRPLDVQNANDCVEGNTNFIMVDRSNIIYTGFEEIKSLSNVRLTLQVQFYGEEAEDYGGPRKEFCNIIMREIFSKYFEKGLREHIAEDYYSVGLVFALSIIQNGKIPRFVEENVLKAIFSNSELDPDSSLWYLRNGLKMLGIYQIGLEMPAIIDILRPSKRNDPTVKSITKLFKPSFSPEGSNRRVHENTVYSAFVKYLRELASVRRKNLKLSNVLQFATCSDKIPILGHVLQPSIEFPEVVERGFLPTANTCISCLKLPRPNHDSPLPPRNELFDTYDHAFSTDFFGRK